MIANTNPKVRALARDYILAHPDANNAEVMEAVPCSMRTVTNARAELRAQGMGKQAFGDRRHHPKVNPVTAVNRATEGTFDTQTTADLNSAVAKELARERLANEAADAELGPDGEIDLAKLKRVLWRVVYRNTDDRIVVAAASAVARIQQEANARPLGAGKPMTRAEAIERLILMFRAVGATIVIEALNKWMGKGPHATETGQPSITPAGATQTT